MSRSVNFNGVFRNQFGARSVLLPGASGETHQMILWETAADDVVGDVEVFRSGPIRIKRPADVFDMALSDGDARCARDVLQAGEKCQVVIADGQSFKVNVTARHYVEEIKISVSVEDRLA